MGSLRPRRAGPEKRLNQIMYQILNLPQEGEQP